MFVDLVYALLSNLIGGVVGRCTTQFFEYQESEGFGGKTCWNRTTWPGRMERIDEDVGRDQMRTCASRRFNRKFEIKKMRLQQTQRQINQGNDHVRTPLVLVVQSEQSFAAIESVGSFSSLMKSESTKSIEKSELIHRKINYRQ